ncbi:MAG: DNA polymerase III subunit epsilon [Rubrivivax sp.]|jgi:DNA polymerase-3 subunit epsilon|nr:DNA polymerase III subunit epsilon [Betaproteobacteria bacterium]MBP6316518.1 DNA polymerase III subunit epsilon [Rubrivivax sp.]MBK7517312.1 DNA polymerase III subunit epsilon [Betaproteobacteria bacterium]MBK8863927.1 DNA polymerase III subunit epsilon [Betaproteobacteria bacterium]MBK9683034.1 DNA polymerase III subunit epsilon [Betaproteobacteria bacterium]
MRQVFLDTETTGLKVAEGDRLIEIGCIELVDRRPTGRRLHHYVNPQRSSHPDAVRVHGISDDFLADKPLFEAVARELLDFVREADVVIHNAAFDLGFIDAELERLGLPRLAEHAGAITDSLALARELFPGKQNSLDALCKRLEVDNSQRELHGALLDAGLLAEVYLRMTRGQKSLVIEAEEVAGSIGAESVVDLSAFELVVLCASEEEAAAHEAVLADIDQASKGKTVWRPAPAAPVLA